MHNPCFLITTLIQDRRGRSPFCRGLAVSCLLAAIVQTAWAQPPERTPAAPPFAGTRAQAAAYLDEDLSRPLEAAQGGQVIRPVERVDEPGRPAPLPAAAPLERGETAPREFDASESAAAVAPRALPPHLRPAEYQVTATEAPAEVPVAPPVAQAVVSPQAPPEARVMQPPAETQRPLPLTRPPSEGRSLVKPGDLPPWLTGAVSLGIVLGLFLMVAWAVRRGMPKGAGSVPSEAVEVLGRTNLAGRQQVHLVRCGNKILLVHVSPTSVETLTEITDPGEVERLSTICHGGQVAGATASFRQALQQFGKQAQASDYMAGHADDIRGGIDFANFESQIDAVGRRRGELRT